MGCWECHLIIVLELLNVGRSSCLFDCFLTILHLQLVESLEVYGTSALLFFVAQLLLNLLECFV